MNEKENIKIRNKETEEKWSAYLEQCDTRFVRHGRMRRSLPHTLIQELTTLVRCHRCKCETDVKAEKTTHEETQHVHYDVGIWLHHQQYVYSDGFFKEDSSWRTMSSPRRHPPGKLQVL
jgi:hypothetical protein